MFAFLSIQVFLKVKMYKRTNVRISGSKVYLNIFKAFDMQNSYKQTKNVGRMSKPQGRLRNLRDAQEKFTAWLAISHV